MKTVNIQVTAGIEKRLAALPGGSRSANTRMVLAAVLAAYRNGDDAAFRMAMEMSGQSSARIRRLLRKAGGEAWYKAVVWIPVRMHGEIEHLIRSSDIQVSDFIRGAVIGATDTDPAGALSDAGSELWNSDISASE